MERPSGQAGSSQRRAASSMQKKQVHRRGGEETHMVRQSTAQPAGCGRKQDRCWQARKREIMASRGGRASHTEERGPGKRGTRNKAARPATSRPAAKQGTSAGHQRERGRSAATAVRIMGRASAARGMPYPPFPSPLDEHAGGAGRSCSQIRQHRAAHSPTAASAPAQHPQACKHSRQRQRQQQEGQGTTQGDKIKRAPKSGNKNKRRDQLVKGQGGAHGKRRPAHQNE